MKKILSLLLVLSCCLGLCACSNNLKPSAIMYEIGDKVSTDCAELTLEEAKFVDYTSEKSCVLLTFSMRNIGKTALGYINPDEGGEGDRKSVV